MKIKTHLLRKFIHRDDEKSKDSLVAEQRTIIFKKSQKENIDDSIFQTNSSDNDSQSTKLASSQTDRPQSGNAFAIAKLRQSIENSRKVRERLAMRVSQKTKTVEAARTHLTTSQNRLKCLLEKPQPKSNQKDSQNNVNSTLHVLQNQFELMNLDQKTMEDRITLESLEEMEDMIRKISHQINNALDFVQKTPLVVRPYDILSLLKDTTRGISVPYGVELKLPLNSDTIRCDSEKIKSVFRNILINAIEAMDESGKITVSITQEDNYCVVEFENTGPKIPEDIIQNIFEPLFTTKTNGNGLGLARCKEILQRHGGKISVYNNPTRFVVYLERIQ